MDGKLVHKQQYQKEQVNTCELNFKRGNIVKMSLPQSLVGKNSIPTLADKETLLQQTYLQAFRDNYDSVQRWTRWKEDHEQLGSFLTTLPDKLSHEVVIPFGSKALMKAKLVHTNEVLTCIGSSWFVKQSAKQGIEMCGRRIKQSENMLSKLESERTLLSNRQTLPKLEAAFPDDGTKEIVEEYNEEAEAEWRLRHREREAQYHHKLAELKRKQMEQSPLQTEEDIFRRLDELELEEELNDELERLHAEYEADYENDDEDEEGESTEEDDEVNQENCAAHGIHHSSELNAQLPSTNSVESDINKRNCDEMLSSSQSSTVTGRSDLSPFCREAWGENSNVDFQAVRQNRRISFADETVKPHSEKKYLGEDVNIYIRFHHSNSPHKELPKESESSLSLSPNEPPLYSTPADIWNLHKVSSASLQPKSILKKSSSLPGKFQGERLQNLPQSTSFGASFGLKFPKEDDNDSASDQPARDLSHLPPVLCDVQESSASGPEQKNEEHSQRRMSHFKSARQRSKKL